MEEKEPYTEGWKEDIEGSKVERVVCSPHSYPIAVLSDVQAE
jgi:hypothetical protein